MRARWVAMGLLLVGIACKGRPGRPAAGHDAARASEAGPVADAGPLVVPPAAPGAITAAVAGRGVQVIDLEYGGFAAPGLPAMRDDGAQIVVVAQGDDGGRGYLDLTARVLDGATGAVVRELRLADPDATSQAISDDDDRGDGAGLARVEAATAATVAEVNRLVTGPWHALVATRRPSADPAPREVVTVDELTFTHVVAEHQLVVARGGNVVAVEALPAPPATEADPDQPCGPEPATLAAVYLDPPTGRALIQLDHQPGGHNCGAAPSTFRVISVGPSRGAVDPR